MVEKSRWADEQGYTHACIPSNWKVEAGGWRIPSHLGCVASLGLVRAVLCEPLLKRHKWTCIQELLC